jgi:hypothetical protein
MITMDMNRAEIKPRGHDITPGKFIATVEDTREEVYLFSIPLQ